MKLLLMERGLWGFISGDEARPGQSDYVDIKKKYCSRSDKDYSIIALGIDKSLQIHLVSTTDPKKAWRLLEEQFSFVSVTQIVRLTHKFYAATMKDNDDFDGTLNHDGYFGSTTS